MAQTYIASLHDFQDLIKRIHSLSIEDRPVPNSKDPAILGFELKLLLAARAPTLVETGRRRELTTVKEVAGNHRYVPMWDISPEQDPELLCKVRVPTIRERKRRGRGTR